MPDPYRIENGAGAMAARIAATFTGGMTTVFVILPATVEVGVGAAQRTEPGFAHVPFTILTG